MDDRIRRLERAWLTTGSIDDEAALLAERVRMGVVDPARVRLAGHLGHPAAAMVAGSGEILVPCDCRTKSTYNANVVDKPGCNRCAGHGMKDLPTDLWETLRRSDVPESILVRWAMDCLEHVRPYCILEEATAPFTDHEHALRTARTSGRPPPYREAVTWAYRLRGHSAEERAWQKQRIGALLLEPAD